MKTRVSGKTLLLSLLALAASLPSVSGESETVTVLDLNGDGISAFSEKSFVGNTDYRVVNEDGEPALRASTRGKASALYRELQVDLQRTPILSWRWKVEQLLDIDNPRQKSGDDYPARVYVVVRDGLLPWQVRVLNYVWANSPQSDSHWPNPFTDRAVMIPLQAGPEHLGNWRHEQVNIAEDFARIFGKPISRIDGVAIMSDADNGGGSALAYYGDIHFVERIGH